MGIERMTSQFIISTGRAVMPTPGTQIPANGKENTSQPFADILQKEIALAPGLIFSKHAQSRISERNMILSPDQLSKMDSAVKKADQKGVKDTLILMDQMAFIVNVPSSTVVTAMSGDDLKENVFTKIDGTVIV